MSRHHIGDLLHGRKARASARLLEDELRRVAQILDAILASEPMPVAGRAEEPRLAA